MLNQTFLDLMLRDQVLRYHQRRIKHPETRCLASSLELQGGVRKVEPVVIYMIGVQEVKREDVGNVAVRNIYVKIARSNRVRKWSM